MNRLTSKFLILTWLAVALCITTATSAYASAKVYQQTLKKTAFILSSKSSGTGSVVDRKKKLLLTNYHVVGEDESVKVYFPQYENGELLTSTFDYFNNSKAYVAKVVARTKRSDLALIQLEQLPEGVEEIQLAKKSATPGSTIHSIGNSGARAGGLWRYTNGPVRLVYHKNLILEFGTVSAWILETQAPINQGDSGGPVVNDAGELVGVVQSFDPKSRVISNNIDIREVKLFLKNYRSQFNKQPLPAPSNSQLVGTWSSEVTGNDGQTRKLTATFQADGNFIWVVVDDTGATKMTGTYTYDDDVLTLVTPKDKTTGGVAWQNNDSFRFNFMGKRILFQRTESPSEVNKNDRALEDLFNG